MDGVAGLPPFALRESARATHIRLTVSAREGLVVVVPMGWRGDAAAIVASKRSWAEKALARVADRRRELLAGPEALMPAAVDLPALAGSWEVVQSEAATARASASGGRIAVTGPDAAARLSALQRWLDRTARDHLPRRVEQLADVHGLSYSGCRVRRVRSRWGSCSRSGSVSLGRNLIFLPPHLVDALILHELAHTRVFDHSPRFWSELAKLDPNALEHRRQLKEAGRFVPAWADA